MPQSQVYNTDCIQFMQSLPDLLLLLPNRNHPYLCIEMKTNKGCQSPAQKAWQQAVEDKTLARYAIVRSVEEFIELITDYLNNR